MTQKKVQKNKSDKYDFMAKVIIIGDSGIGKTNLITRFCQSNFKQSYVATIGVDFKVKTLNIGNRRYKLQIWDTAGQERFKNITQTYYKGAAGIILTYSIIDRTSFQNVQRWMTQIETHAPPDVSKVLLATKCDLNYERQVTTEEGTAIAKKYGIPFVQVSAKSDLNVKEGFQALVKQIHKIFDKKGQTVGITTKTQVVLGKKQVVDSNRKNCAC